jgi:hypothetical protein
MKKTDKNREVSVPSEFTEVAEANVWQPRGAPALIVAVLARREVVTRLSKANGDKPLALYDCIVLADTDGPDADGVVYRMGDLVAITGRAMLNLDVYVGADSAVYVCHSGSSETPQGTMLRFKTGVRALHQDERDLIKSTRD